MRKLVVHNKSSLEFTLSTREVQQRVAVGNVAVAVGALLMHSVQVMDCSCACEDQQLVTTYAYVRSVRLMRPGTGTPTSSQIRNLDFRAGATPCCTYLLVWLCVHFVINLGSTQSNRFN